MSNFQVWATILAVVVIYLYTYFKKKYSFWRDKSVSTPRILPFVGNALDITLGSFHDAMLRNTKLCGKTYGIYQITKPILVTSDPEIIKNMTIRDSHIFLNHPEFSGAFDEIGKKFLFNLDDEEWSIARHHESSLHFRKDEGHVSGHEELCEE
ncbi:Cytochrome P450 3A11 [Halotydeus destructor]|nr:Cytochrome P450 3A11 [Halotydeus destructor]